MEEVQSPLKRVSSHAGRSSDEKRRYEAAITRRNSRLTRRREIEANEVARLKAQSKKKK